MIVKAVRSTLPSPLASSWSIEFISFRDSDVSRTAVVFFFSSRRRHTRLQGDWSSDVCSSDLQRLSDATCTALQLANFWQDVARDLEIGRIYIPLDAAAAQGLSENDIVERRSEERRVGKECRSRWSPYH